MDLNKKQLLNYLLLPLSGIFFVISFLRKWFYKIGLFKVHNFATPVIVVGNIIVGGTGKTPIVIALVKHFQALGKQVGVVSRGYKGTHQQGSLLVENDTPASVCGDEPLLILLETQAPIMVNKNRTAALKDLINNNKIDLVISDDGLQHYAMGRQVEIAVINSARRFGNGFFLPAGPMREPKSRLKTVDFVINNGSKTKEITTKTAPQTFSNLVPKAFINLVTNQQQPVDFFNHHACYGVTGIGYPQGFFDTLSALGVELIISKTFADHHFYSQNDLTFENDYPIIMTAKDCVKCDSFATKQMWYLHSQASLDEEFLTQLSAKL
ncbi:MAG: tetraacyldisaccharide 4'-kinase [Candidatus Thioglobus sp.]|nr:tetraacyldisaccharide 4'-kinase [Candidatus Thioglobus sp.]